MRVDVGLQGHQGQWLTGFPGLLSAAPDTKCRDCSKNVLHPRPSPRHSRDREVSLRIPDLWAQPGGQPGKAKVDGGRARNGLSASGSHCCSRKGEGQSHGHEDTSLNWNNNGLSGLVLIKRETQDTTHLRETLERPSTKTSHITQDERARSREEEGEEFSLWGTC